MTTSRTPRRPTALVTGGAVRVGRAISLALADAGRDVAVHHHSSAEEARTAVAAVEEQGRRAVAVEADLSRAETIPDLIGRAVEELGGLDLVVNNAAIFPRARPEEVTPGDWDRTFAVNARAPFFVAREAAAAMEDDGGVVVNIADVAAFEAWPAYAPYAASKAALVSLTRSLARAWAPRVRVNAVAPGPVLLPEGTSPEERERAEASTAMGRVGRPGDVADAVLYLAGAEFVTGEVIRVDGGEHVARRPDR